MISFHVDFFAHHILVEMVESAFPLEFVGWATYMETNP